MNDTRQNDDGDVHHYSGDDSHWFWDRVNALPYPERHEAYSLGCALQDLEHRVIATLIRLESETRRQG